MQDLDISNDRERYASKCRMHGSGAYAGMKVDSDVVEDLSLF